MTCKHGLGGVATLIITLATLAACGGGGDSSPTPATTSKAWGTASLIETDNAGGAYNPQIAIDASGNALAVWFQHDGTRYNIWANRYTAGAGWGAAALIETDNAGGAQTPQIAIDASGNALVVWAQHDGTRNNIWANRYTVGTGWGTASLIETDNVGGAQTPQIAIEASGNALVVWVQDDGTENSIFANRYTASNNAWGSAVVIEADNVIGHSADEPQIALDASGNAIAVWQQSDGMRTNVWGNRYTVGTGWGTAALIETDDAGSVYTPQIAISPSGNAVAVWQQHDGTRNNIAANRYTVGTGWGTAALIEADNAFNAGTVQIAFDANGNALAVWVQGDGMSNVWANRYTNGSGWGTAALIETNNTGTVGAPQIAFDASGNAIAVWQQSDGTRDNIWANHYTIATGWGTATLIETDDVGGASDPQIALDTSGNALAVWFQSATNGNQLHNIWANRYQ